MSIGKLVRNVVLLIVLYCFFAFFSLDIVETLFECTLPKNYLFYEIDEIFEQWVTYIIIFFAMLLALKILRLFGVNDFGDRLNNLIDIAERSPRFIKISVLVICLFLAYSCASNSAIVTEDSIIVRTMFNPAGKEYSYEDVDKIETGFGEKRFAIRPSDRKGEFSYRIFVDGHRVVFSLPMDNENIKEYYDDSYYCLEVLDKDLIKANPGIKKVTGLKYSDSCDLDKRYVERFIRIANNG